MSCLSWAGVFDIDVVDPFDGKGLAIKAMKMEWLWTIGTGFGYHTESGWDRYGY